MLKGSSKARKVLNGRRKVFKILNGSSKVLKALKMLNGSSTVLKVLNRQTRVPNSNVLTTFSSENTALVWSVCLSVCAFAHRCVAVNNINTLDVRIHNEYVR